MTDNLPPTINATTASNPAALNQNVLSNGSAFMLLTTLLAALVFHPFGGSLVYGPSERFWLASPIAVSLEIGVIWKRLAEQLLHSLRKTRFSFGSRELSSIRRAAFAILAARTLNSRNGHAKRQALRNGDDEEVLDIVDDHYAEITEGYRFRIAIVFPIVAQYIKIGVVGGPHTTFLRVLGTLYLVHWITLEFLISFAKRPLDDNLIARLHKLLPGGDVPIAAASQNEDTASHRQDDSIWEYSMFFTHSLLFWFAAPILGLFRPGSTGNEGVTVSASLPFFSMTVKTSIPPIPMAFAVFVPLCWLLYRAWRFIVSCFPKLTTDDDSRPRRRRRLALHAGSIGGEIGTICFMYWIIYCGWVYDASGTTRPDWPWLDWLG